MLSSNHTVELVMKTHQLDTLPRLRLLLLALLVAGSAATSAGCEEEATPCTTTDDCAIGEVCGDDALCAATGESFVVASLASVNVDSSGSANLSVKVPADAESVAVVIDGAGSSLVIAQLITNPSGTVVFDFQRDVNTNRTDATDGVYTVLIPNNPDVTLEAGEWVLNLRGAGDAFSATTRAVLKASPASANKLDLNLYFVGLDGLDASSAPTDADFQEILTNVSAVFGGANAALGEISYNDITGADADTFRTIETTESPNGELYQLFKLSNGATNRALDFFFVADIAGSGGFSLLGLSGGVPGPPGIHGTLRSGVAVNMADLLAARASGDPAQLAEAKATTELIMAHEGGHYLGLYHTTERNGQTFSGINGKDHLGDTPECPDSADDGDGVLSPGECDAFDTGNLMFWSPRNDSRTLTDAQKFVLHANPLVR